MTGGHIAAWYAATRKTSDDRHPPARAGRSPAAPAFDIEQILASIETMAAQRPVAAQIVSVANAEDTSAKALALILAGTWPWPAGS